MPFFFARIKSLFCIRIFILCVISAYPANCLEAVPSEEIEETEGLVWFIGTVEQVIDGVPLIDLGEVHTLRTPAERP